MFNGVFTALITPFHRDGSIDWEGLKKLVKKQIDHGISGLVPVGTTGESPTLSHEENLQVVEWVIKAAEGKVPVIAGTGSNCTAEAIRMTQKAKELGATASLQVAPYYNKPNQEGLYRHFVSIADQVDMPLVVYNIKGRSGINIQTDTLMRMAQHPNVVAVKEASGDLSQMMDVIGQRPEGFSVLSGDDNLTVPLTLMGGNGMISVVSNIIPQIMEEMVQAALAGDISKAREFHYKLMPLFKAMSLDTNPIPVKAAMAELGYCEGSYRLPLCAPSDEIQQKIRQVLKDYKLL
ncbi:MAG: 4-hydroxy-tetrahydrodipicolinate synthase [Spirochaetaceae bacterium]|jgi:4-hydroxy-tetrahydrodipicolinate synthase|nr:4-hydroxy-tetrahydrodipicolinate synthase [Spirochaetaceae bacterium]